MTGVFRLTATVAAVCVFVMAPLAHGGGTFVNTVQNGAWSSASTWDLRVPDESLGDQARISHVVSVTSAGQNSNVLQVGWSAGAGTLNISAGALSVNAHILVGDEASTGTLNISGGDVVATDFVVGLSGTGEVTISGGTLNVSSFTNVGVNGFPAMVTVQGGTSTMTMSSLQIGADATLVIRPAGNGAAGLSSVDGVGVVTLDAGSTLELDTSLYTPAPGDAWDVVTSDTSISGTFGTLVAPPGLTIEQDDSVSGVLTIRVVEPIPAASTWGLAVLMLMVIIGGTLLIARRASAVAAS